MVLFVLISFVSVIFQSFRFQCQSISVPILCSFRNAISKGKNVHSQVSVRCICSLETLESASTGIGHLSSPLKVSDFVVLDHS